MPPAYRLIEERNAGRIRRRSRLLLLLLLLELALAVAVPVFLKLYLLKDRSIFETATGPSTMFLLLFILSGIAAAVGVQAVLAKRSCTLLLAFVMQLVTAMATIVAAAGITVYLEVVCTLYKADASLIALLKQEWGNVTCASEVLHSARTELTAETFVSWLAPTAENFVLVSLSFTALLLLLNVLLAHTLIRLRFDLVKAAREHKRGWRGARGAIRRRRAIRRRAIRRRAIRRNSVRPHFSDAAARRPSTAGTSAGRRRCTSRSG